MKHIIFIIGSLRKKSFNRQLAKIAEEMLKDRFEISYLYFEDIPYMNQDLESQYDNNPTRQQDNGLSQSSASVSEPMSKPKVHLTEDGELEAGHHRIASVSQQSTANSQSISRVRQQIKQCDGIWIFTPEYNHSYPGLLKNLFDWLSRPIDISNFTVPTVIQGKKVTISGAGGKNKTMSCREKLNELLEYIKMDVMKEPQVGMELGIEAWVKGEFHLTEEQLKQLKEQADKFAEFVVRT